MSEDPQGALATAGSNPDALGGRLPLVAVDDLNGAQRALYDYMADTRFPEARKGGYVARLPDGRVIGPFNAMLRTPEIARALNGWVDAIDAHATLAGDVRQVAILTVGTHWNVAYELYAHTAAGGRAGLSGTAMDAIKAGRAPADVSPDAAVAYRFVHALVTERSVPDALYTATERAFGVEQLTELLYVVGVYQTISGLLTTYRVPAPDAGQQG